MNALLKLSLSSLAMACLASCGGGGDSGGKPVDESAALRVVAEAAQAASASSTPPVESAQDPSLALIERAANAGQATDTGAATGSAAVGASGGAVTTAAAGTQAMQGLNSSTASTHGAPAMPSTGATGGAATPQAGESPASPSPASAAVAPIQLATASTKAPAAPVMVFSTPTRPAVTTGTATSKADLQVSQPEPPLADCGLGDSTEVILRRINEIRARGASCGAKGEFAPATALVWNTKLYAAAAGHSTDMAVNNYFAHLSPAGQAVRDRVVELGYAYKLVAENIAAGQPSLDKVLAAWLASEGHCANLMQPAVRDVALACASEQGATYPTYWTLNIAGSR
jgi:uncharacterized protein YkwD